LNNARWAEKSNSRWAINTKGKAMKLFNLMNTELEFLKKGLELNAPVAKGFDVLHVDCVHCESLCQSGCGGNCSGPNTSCHTA